MAKLLFGPGVLLLSGAFSPQAVLAQAAAPEVEAPNALAADTGVDVVAPGGEIVILGRRDRNIQRGAPQVL